LTVTVKLSKLYEYRMKIDWMVGGISTFIAVASANILTYLIKVKREESRQVADKILKPLYDDLKRITDIRYHRSPDELPEFRWGKIKEEEKRLYRKVPRELRKTIETFNEMYQRYSELRRARLMDLKITSIVQSVGKDMGESLSLVGGSACKIYYGRDPKNVRDFTIVDLLIEGKSVEQKISEIHKMFTFKENIKEECYIEGTNGVRMQKCSVNKAKFIKLFSEIEKRIAGDSELQNYLEQTRNVISEAEKLLKRIERKLA